jgi:hypothetical protein
LKFVDTTRYVGVRCEKCDRPILFGIERTSRTGAHAAARLLLTCAEPSCRHRADYAEDRVSRFEKDANGVIFVVPRALSETKKSS